MSSDRTWRIDRSWNADLPAGATLEPSRSSLWLLVRSGSVVLGAHDPVEHPIELRAGDAAYVHHAALHPVHATDDSRLLVADLRAQSRSVTRLMVARGFAGTQSGIVALLSACPVRGEMKIERPGVTTAYGELLGSAMLSEQERTIDERLPRSSADPVVRAAATAMADDPTRNWTLPELAALSHVGTTTLVQRFRHTTGLAPMQLLRRLRMRQAMSELAGSDAAVAAIARRSGYGSAEAFVRAFRAETGLTPGRWRQSARGTSLITAKPTAASVAATAPTAMAVQTSR
ncbi:MAG TPA: AraC family transcriptional regulator [Flexivirga sp.]|uniref:AraC family transcriptional regulator n=1 Tax=Flexivirga sp. TaxID=1962927 RepID=UPI002C7B2177|nr:AraC family transcriptional regulator [Flexivirga sp.]HWC23320.1 AraC family transcriptional regulator [Flexivirga sp.]